MEQKFKRLNMKGADCWYCPNFFTGDGEQELWYELIDNSVDWQQFMIKVYGKTMAQPRDSFYMADNGYPYKYSGFDRKPDDWTVAVTEMKKVLDVAVKNIESNHPKLNAVLGNRYRDGHQNIGAHSDNESDLHGNAFIVSVSLGAARDFIFTHKETKEKVKILLEPGSVLLMGGNCQKNWRHALPKRLCVKDPRINLTFRSVLIRGGEP
jgi:alkylated DNA repair dioxygenase AlkB